MTDWQPISTAPKDESVLVYLPEAAKGMEYEIAHCSSDDPDGDWYCSTHNGFAIDVDATHWMPLPDPPPGILP